MLGTNADAMLMLMLTRGRRGKRRRGSFPHRLPNQANVKGSYLLSQGPKGGQLIGLDTEFPSS